MTTQFLAHQGGKIAFDDRGSGPLIVCSPSMGDLRAEYRFLAPALAERGFRVVTLDVRGHGESTTDWDDYSVAGVGSDLAALLRRLNAGPAVLFGESMSAGAAVWAAAEAPEWVAGLVLAGPFARGETSAFNRLLYRALFARPWGPDAWLAYFSSLFPSRKPEDFAIYSQNLRDNLRQPGRLEALQRMLPASKAAAEARLGHARAPALVLMGSRDPDFKDPAAEARWLAGQLHARLEMIDGVGHYPHVEALETVLPILMDFLGGIDFTTGGQRES